MREEKEKRGKEELRGGGTRDEGQGRREKEVWWRKQKKRERSKRKREEKEKRGEEELRGGGRSDK